MFKVKDDADETPHIIPGSINDSGPGMDFFQHLQTKTPSDLDDDTKDEGDDSGTGDNKDESPRPLI